ncbi:MAG: hypothetical protein E6J90_45390 [Deltaproteobacteria bacterium]|nr:MAG: hypothetical protein E6J90_45390 [Deltaproteobacteria bacterium]
MLSARSVADDPRLSTKINRGVAWAAAAQTVIAITDMVSQIVVVALFVSSDDLGVAAGATAFYTLLDTAADFGVTSALIQRDDHTPDAVSTVFWFNLLVSLGLVVALLGLGPLYGRFVHKPVVGWLLVAYGGKLLVQNLYAIPFAMLRRELHRVRRAGLHGVVLDARRADPQPGVRRDHAVAASLRAPPGVPAPRGPAVRPVRRAHRGEPDPVPAVHQPRLRGGAARVRRARQRDLHAGGVRRARAGADDLQRGDRRRVPGVRPAAHGSRRPSQAADPAHPAEPHRRAAVRRADPARDPRVPARVLLGRQVDGRGARAVRRRGADPVHRRGAARAQLPGPAAARRHRPARAHAALHGVGHGGGAGDVRGRRARARRSARLPVGRGRVGGGVSARVPGAGVPGGPIDRSPARAVPARLRRDLRVLCRGRARWPRDAVGARRGLRLRADDRRRRHGAGGDYPAARDVAGDHTAIDRPCPAWLGRLVGQNATTGCQKLDSLWGSHQLQRLGGLW